MPAFRSYADLMASKPPPPSSSAPAVRKPLLHTSPPRTQSLTAERRGSTAVRTSSPSSLSVIADSPRRLLSYYLSKAAYNTDESDTGYLPQADRYEDHPDAMAQDENNFAEAHAVQPSASFSSRPLRPPPFAQSVTSSKGLSATPAPTPVPPVPSPRLHQQPPSPFVRSSRPAEKRVNFSLASEAVGETSMEAPRTAASPAAGRGTARAAVSAVDDAGKQANDASLPPPHTHASQRMPSPLITTPSLVRYTAYTEEQQRQYEAEIMAQVDALLQAQRSEWRAEVEAHRLTAQEAQATLSVIENALSEQLGGTAVAASDLTARLTFSSSAARVPSPAPPSAADIDRLAMDMMRVAAAATPGATQRLLDAIMSIHDGQDVPSELLQVVRSLYEELTRALVPPVMDFVQTPCGYEQQQQLPPHVHRSGDASVLQHTTDQSEALLEAQATILALQEEVMMVRRALNARLSSGCVLPSTSKSTESTATASTSTETVRQALLDRFFDECHGALTRSRQESLTLRRALEEERRRHFLTRIRLLGPTAASDGLPAAQPQQQQGMAASPTQRSSTASRERPLSAPRVSAASPATLLKASGGRSSVHRWTPATSPMALASQSAGNDEEAEGDEDVEMADVEDSIGTASDRESASSVDLQARRASTSTDRPLRAPALHTALRVADEVLRTTAGNRGAEDTPTAHPYYAQRRPAAARHDASVAERNAPEKTRRPQGEVSGPSVTFAEAPTGNFQEAASASRGHRGNDLPSSGAIARAAGTATDVLGPQPNSEYERRVWSTAVELLSRYSVA